MFCGSRRFTTATGPYPEWDASSPRPHILLLWFILGHVITRIETSIPIFSLQSQIPSHKRGFIAFRSYSGRMRSVSVGSKEQHLHCLVRQMTGCVIKHAHNSQSSSGSKSHCFRCEAVPELRTMDSGTPWIHRGSTSCSYGTISLFQAGDDALECPHHDGFWVRD